MYRTAALLVLLTAVLLGPAAEAAPVPMLPGETALLPVKCPKGSSIADPSESKVFWDGKTESEAITAFLKRKIACPSACYNERISLAIAQRTDADGGTQYGLSFKVAGTDACADKSKIAKQQTPPRGCEKGATQPQVTLDIPKIEAGPLTILKAQTVGPKSRCSVDAISSAIDSMINKLTSRNPMTIAGIQGDLQHLENLTGEAAPVISNPMDPAQYGQVLKAFDPTLTDEQIKEAIETKPDAVKAIAACAAGDSSCSTETFKQAAKDLGITLNADTTNQIARLKADWQRDNPEMAGDDPAPGARSPDTFAPDSGPSMMDRARCAIATIESGSCAGNYNTIGPVTSNGHRAYGKYQVMDFNIPSWTAQSCGYALTPGSFLADTGCQEKVFEKVFGGYISSCGNAEAAASKWFSGGCGITNASDGGLTVPQYVRKFASIFGSTTLPFGSAASIYTAGSSPFANVNPFNTSGSGIYQAADGNWYLANPQMTVAPVGQPASISSGTSGASGSSGTTGSVSSGSGSVSSGSSQTTGTTATVTAPAIPAEVSIIVDPKDVQRGEKVTVKWTSASASDAKTCRIYAGTAAFATGNSGSKEFDTSRVTAPSTVTFTIECYSRTSGAPTGAEATVSVR